MYVENFTLLKRPFMYCKTAEKCVFYSKTDALKSPDCLYLIQSITVMEGKQYIAYFQVSTQKQGQSGLGMEAQQYAIRAFLKPGYIIVKEYIEVESGK